MLPEVIEAAHKLGEKGISAQVVSFHTVKPLDEAYIKQAFGKFKLVATIEEHSLIGGFGAAVSEWLVDSKIPNQNFMRFGTPDAFFKKSGEQEYAREMLGLRAHQILQTFGHGVEVPHQLRDLITPAARRSVRTGAQIAGS